MATVLARVRQLVTYYQHDLTVSLLSQDTTANTSRVSFEYVITNTSSLANGSWNFGGQPFTVTINGVAHTANVVFDFRDYRSRVMVSGEQTITHDSNGAKSFVARMQGSAVPTSAYFLAVDKSQSVTLPSIVRASSFTVTPTSVIQGGEVEIKITRASSGFTHDITWESEGQTGTIGTGVATSVKWSPPETLLGTFERVPITITVTTKSGSTQIGSPVSRDILYKRPPVYPEVGLGTPFDVRVRRVKVEGGKLVAKEEIPYLSVTTTDTMSASGSCTLETTRALYDESLDEAVILIDMYDGAQWLDNDGMLLVLSRTERDLTDASEVVTYTGMSYADYLLSKNMIAADLEWPSTTPGDVIWQYITIGKNRGWGPHVRTSFSKTKTTSNTNFQHTDAPKVTRGTPLSQILSGFVSDALVEYRTWFDHSTGKAVVDLYNPGNGEDWTGSGADFAVNLELAAMNKVADRAPVRKDSASKLTRVMVQGEEMDATRESAANVNPMFGHLEGSADAGGVKVRARLNELGDALLSMNKSATVERTFSYDLSSTQTPSHLFPYRTFRTGDWILIPGESGPERVRVSQVAITRNAEGTKATITTGDLIPNGVVAVARKISQATGGAIPGGTLRSPGTLSSAIPSAPLNVTTQIDGYWDVSGAPRSGVEVSWNEVVSSMEGTPIVVDLYEVWTRGEVGMPWNLATLSDVTQATLPPLPINSPLDIRVRGRSQSGVFGDFSDPISIVTLPPDETLPAPAGPFLEVDGLGTVSITWSGTLGGLVPPPWFNFLRAEISDAENGAYSHAGQQLLSAGTITVANVGVGTWWFRLVPYDTLNVRGAGSIALSIEVVPMATDTRKPKAPTNVVATSAGYWSGAQAQSRVDVSWDAVTQAEDDSAIAIRVYEVWGKQSSDTTYMWLGATESTSLAVHPVSPLDAEWDIQVTATAVNNERSAASNTAQVTMAGPAMAMDPPTAPDLSSRSGIVVVSWDGNMIDVIDPDTEDGTVLYPAPEFVTSVDIQVSLDDGASWSTVGFMPKGERTQSVAGAAVGATVLVRLVAYDILGQISAASEPASVTVAGFDGSDLLPGSVGAAHIEAGSIGVNHVAPGFGNDLNISANGTISVIAGQAADAQQAAEDAGLQVEAMRTRYDFTPTEAVISQPGSAFQVGISNTDLEFRESGVRRAWLNVKGFTAPVMNTERVEFARHVMLDDASGFGTVIRRK